MGNHPDESLRKTTGTGTIREVYEKDDGTERSCGGETDLLGSPPLGRFNGRLTRMSVFDGVVFVFVVSSGSNNGDLRKYVFP